jgi:hypothetical protein
MEQMELIERVSGPGPDAGHAYRLAALGTALEPAVHALGRWGWKQMSAPAKGDHRSFDFLMVALRRRYRGNASVRAELVADGTPYRLILSGAHAEIARGDVASPDVRLRGPGPTLARLFLDETTRKRIPSDVSVEGSAESLRALLDAFAMSDTEIVTSPPGSKGRRSART